MFLMSFIFSFINVLLLPRAV